MDQNALWVKQMKIEATMKALAKNNFTPHFVENSSQLIALLSEMVPENSRVAVGGSMSLFESGVMDFLRSSNVEFWDRYTPELTAEDIRQIYLKNFDADIYFTSSNAVTEDGCLFNVDGTGNRVAAMVYGPRQVFVIVGENKLVKDLPAAIARNREIAAPANAKRLNRETPCAKTGFCTDCNSPERICADYVLMKHQGRQDRVHVFIVGESLGY